MKVLGHISLALTLTLSTLSLGCLSLPPKEPTWQAQTWKLPYPARVQWEALGAHEASMEAAIEAFPCDMFQEAKPGTSANVRVHISDDRQNACGGTRQQESDAPASAYLCSDGTAEIWVSPSALSDWNTTQSYLAFAHELGHVAGLEHDPYQRTLPSMGPAMGIPATVSIMTPNVTDHSARLEAGLLLPTVSFADEDALEARYCQ